MQHLKSQTFYEGTPRLSENAAARRMRLRMAALVLWEATQGDRNSGRPILANVDALKVDAGVGKYHQTGEVDGEWRTGTNRENQDLPLTIFPSMHCTVFQPRLPLASRLTHHT